MAYAQGKGIQIALFEPILASYLTIIGRRDLLFYGVHPAVSGRTAAIERSPWSKCARRLFLPLAKQKKLLRHIEQIRERVGGIGHFIEWSVDICSAEQIVLARPGKY